MKKAVALIIALVLIAAAGAVGFFVGRNTADKADGADGAAVAIYAEIMEINDSCLYVKGLDINDINGRGEFVFSIDEDTPLRWHGTEITLEELNVGDNIAIYYSGDVLEIYPAQITNVLQLVLLDDEK